MKKAIAYGITSLASLLALGTGGFLLAFMAETVSRWKLENALFCLACLVHMIVPLICIWLVKRGWVWAGLIVGVLSSLFSLLVGGVTFVFMTAGAWH